MENLESNTSYYSPSFFRMKVDGPVDLGNLNEVTDGTLAAYLHEYIHFIQDISTIYGLMNISNISYYIQNGAYQLSKQSGNAFHVPIMLKDEENDFGYNNHKLNPIYIGCPINPKKKKIEIQSYSKSKKQWGDDTNKLLDVIDVTIKDGNNQVSTFQLGGNHVCEGMAYSCESYIYEDILANQGISIPVDEYPYLVVQKLAELIYPELSKCQLLVVAACDASLMTYNPGLSFVRLLEYMNEISFLANEITLDEFYTVSHNLLKGVHYDFNTILENVRGQLKNYFRVDDFEGNNAWLDVLFDRIKEFRNDHPGFVVDIIQSGDLKKNELFLMFHGLFGSPLVLNSEDDPTITLPLGFKNDNFHPGLYWGVNQVLKIFRSYKPMPCELKKYCINSSKVDSTIVVDERCDTAPWKRCYDDHLCPFAAVWKHWNLKNLYPIFP